MRFRVLIPYQKPTNVEKTHTPAFTAGTARFRRFWNSIGITGMGSIQLDPLFTTPCVQFHNKNDHFGAEHWF